MENDKSIKQISKDEEITISLPVKKKDLGQFISGLLGQQQTIERDIDINFDIDHLWLLNLHDLISQRIHQQADAHLTDFTSVIYFKKGLKRTFTSIEAFRSYLETKKELPVGIKIIWNYLIQFPAKEYPEKQQITFSAQIHSQNRAKATSIKDRFKLEYFIFNTISGESERSSLNYQIDHTERTWGADIEVIISNQVDEVTRGNQVKDTLYNLSRLMLAIIMLLFTLIYPIYSDLTDRTQNIDELINNYLALDLAGKSLSDGVNEKLDHIVSMIEVIGKPNNEKGFEVFILLLGMPITLIMLRLTRKSTYSFMVLSKEAKNYRELKLKQEKRSVWILIGSFILSVLAGIVSSFGFTWILT